MSGATDDGAVRLWAQRMRTAGSLADGISDDDVVAIVSAALDRARRDHRNYSQQRRARSAMVRSIQRVERLAGDAAKSDRGKAALAATIGDGSAVDEHLSLAMGEPIGVARAAAAALRSGTAVRAVRHLEEVAGLALRYATDGRGQRRSERFFAVVSLAFGFVALTGRVPTFTTPYDGDAEGKRTGDFVDLVEAAHLMDPISDGDAGFGRVIVDALRIGKAALRTTADTADILDPLDHPPFGSAAFVTVVPNAKSQIALDAA